MNTSLKLEEFALLALAIYLNASLPYPGWWYAAFFLAPDIGMLGYLINSRIGAVTYNLLHHRLVAVACCLAGWAFQLNMVAFMGVLMLGHISFDRLLGYGLKFADDFKHTHLGWIGKPSDRPAGK